MRTLSLIGGLAPASALISLGVLSAPAQLARLSVTPVPGSQEVSNEFDKESGANAYQGGLNDENWVGPFAGVSPNSGTQFFASANGNDSGALEGLCLTKTLGGTIEDRTYEVSFYITKYTDNPALLLDGVDLADFSTLRIGGPGGTMSWKVTPTPVVDARWVTWVGTYSPSAEDVGRSFEFTAVFRLAARRSIGIDGPVVAADGGECRGDVVCDTHETQKLTASDAAAGDEFGTAVALSGDRILVGARHEACVAGARCGSAYVFRYDDGAWLEEQKLTALDAEGDEQFGHAVSLFGERALVGARNDGCAAGARCGSAYVYRYDGTAWALEAKLTAADAAPGDQFSKSLSIAGDWAFVGAYSDDCSRGEDCGSAYIYHYDGTRWVQVQKLTAPQPSAYDQFGGAVSVFGEWAFVGAGGRDCASGDYCGSAYVYRNAGPTWILWAALTPSDAAAGDYFGFAASISDDRALVTAPNDRCAAGPYCGSVYVYRFDGTTWIEEQRLTAFDAGEGDGFGFSVSISADRVLVGAANDDCVAGGFCGSAYVYRYDGNIWVAVQKLTASEPAEADWLGASVSLSGDRAIVAASGRACPAGSYCGAAYSFDLSGEDCNCNELADQCDIAECDGDPACADCNENGVPDECDVAECPGDPTCGDVNGNGVPDGCESCLAPPEPAGTPCGDSSEGRCDHPDTCDGNGSCIPNLAPDDSPCDDGLYCTIEESCLAGQCVGLRTPCEDAAHCDEARDRCICLADEECDDGDECTADSCTDGDCTHQPDCVEVLLDIKPGSCTNPLNAGAKGVLPVAILGGADFDVREIVPESVVLMRADGGGERTAALPRGVAWEDVESTVGPAACACYERRRDGLDDLALKFDAQAVARTLNLIPTARNNRFELSILGRLRTGQAFRGTDCVRIVPDDASAADP